MSERIDADAVQTEFIRDFVGDMKTALPSELSFWFCCDKK